MPRATRLAGEGRPAENRCASRFRGMAHEFGLRDLKAIPEHVEEFALKHFAKV